MVNTLNLFHFLAQGVPFGMIFVLTIIYDGSCNVTDGA